MHDEAMLRTLDAPIAFVATMLFTFIVSFAFFGLGRFFDGRGFDGVGEFAVARKDLGTGEVLLPELRGELGPAEDAGEFGEKRLRGEKNEPVFAGRLDQPLRRAAPEQGGGDDVGVKDDARGLREARRAPPSVRIRVRPR